MKKFSILFLAVLLTGIVMGQDVKRQTIKRITQADYGLEWYQTQMKLWKEEVDRNPSSEEAWWNYYEAQRGVLHKSGGNPFTEESPAMEIVNEMEKSIPNTFTFYHCKANQLGNHTKDCVQYLKKAYNLQPNNPLTYENLIVHYEMHGNLSKRKEIVNKLYKYGDVSVGILNYCYNVLMTLDESGILITAGDNDTYPMWVLQDVFNVRPDVAIINRSMIKDSSYAKIILKRLGINPTKDEKKSFIRDTRSIKQGEDHIQHTKTFIKLAQQKSGRNVYVAHTAWVEGLYGLESDLYNVGLAHLYSTQDIDNVAFLKRNYHKRYKLDYLYNPFYKESNPDYHLIHNGIYSSSLLTLRAHAKASEDTEEFNWATDLLNHLAENTTETYRGYIKYYMNQE